MNTAALRTDDTHLIAEARSKIDAAMARYDNEDTIGERYAFSAYVAGKAAFWSMATYHSQRACKLMLLVNEARQDKDAEYLKGALRLAYGGGDLISALDCLVPLNERAARDMTEAYASFGLWREESELLERGRPRTRVLS